MNRKENHQPSQKPIDLRTAHQAAPPFTEEPIVCRGVSCNMNFVAAFVASYVLIFMFANAAIEAQTIPLFDTMDWDRDPDPDVTRWRGWPESSTEWQAQPFLTGDQDNVSSVTIDIQREGSPSGTLSLEVWDDDGTGIPGSLVGTVGSIDLSSLSDEWQFITLDDRVAGLIPNSPYHLVWNTGSADIDTRNTYKQPLTSSAEGTNSADFAKVHLSGDNWPDIVSLIGNNNYRFLQMSIEASVHATAALLAGDADQDLDFDQLDVVQAQAANKYLTGQAATWGEGDWDGAPGGSQGNPPAGDGQFNQIDIIAAQQGDVYLTGPYASIVVGGQRGDGQTSVIYDPSTGELAVDAPRGVELTSINIDSAGGIFTGIAAENLGGSFDNDADRNIFKATFGSSFGSLSFGNVAQAGLSEDFVLADLTVIGSLAGGGDLGNVDLIYVPEPASVLLLSIGLAIGLVNLRRVNR